MIERIINRVLTEGRDKLTAGSAAGGQNTLRRFLQRSLGWEDAEVEKLVAFWNDDGAPTVVHGYPREVTRFPCWAVILTSEAEAEPSYLGHEAGLIPQAEALIQEVEADVGHPVQAKIHRWQVSYDVVTYAEHPDVVVAFHRIAQNILIAKEKILEVDGCLEEPRQSSADLMPLPNYLPTNLFTRKTTLSGFIHVLTTEELGLGVLALGRGTKVAGIHVNNHVIGVNPGVNPYNLDEDD